MKQRASVNYSLYIKDYWAISYSHPGLGQHAASTSRHPSMHLPNLPTNTSTACVQVSGGLDRVLWPLLLLLSRHQGEHLDGGADHL